MLERLAGRAVTGRVAFLLSGLIDVGVLTAYLIRMRRRRRTGSAGLLLLLAACALIGAGAALAGAPANARADTTEPSILMDDNAFIYASPARIESNLEQAAALGVNTIKVSVVWSLVAPDADSRTEPKFDAADPGAYPAGAWTRYDTLDEEATRLGMSVYFQLTAPAPAWATDPHVSGKQHRWSHDPDAAAFGQFVRAVGERYSGSFPAPASAPTDQGTLPAVQMWGIWNEPNEVGWVSPQTTSHDGHTVLTAPEIYRGLANAGYRALLATGHGLDTILIGETASGGTTKTVPFVRTLFCLGGDYQPLTGTAATRVGCPASGNPAIFVQDNPGLFEATGWAHHPYSFNHTPATPFADAPSTITMANLGVLERTLDRASAAYDEPTGLPIYITEWGYKSDPPDPYVATSLLQQETWLDEGWYMSYLMPRVKSMAQELLYDQTPVAGKRPGSSAYWSGFYSGLEFDDGTAKPAYAAFRLPIWLPSQRAGTSVRLWAELRPATVSANSVALLEYQAPGSTVWSALTQLSSSNPEGFIDTRVAIPEPGTVRLAWYDPTAREVDYSRDVTIS